MKISGDGSEVTPKGGFPNYGEIKAEYLMVKGSIPGPVKRLVTLRHAVRTPEITTPRYKIEAINLDSKQGA